MMIDFWQNIYLHFDPIAFTIGSIKVHWYGIMYAFALIFAIFVAKYFIKTDKLNITDKIFDSYIFWAEIGVILGARLGYIIFYSPHTLYYLTKPWEIFNPYVNGIFVGISGMSYHGAVFGFLIATYLFTKKERISFWYITDASVLGISAAYIFGRFGNFFNQELLGRTTEVPWGIYVNGILRHPSQLYEAFLEGALVFIILFLIRKKTSFTGELTIAYGILYSLARIFSEYFREPDVQLGFLYKNWLTMGMIQSGIIISLCIFSYIYLKKISIKS